MESRTTHSRRKVNMGREREEGREREQMLLKVDTTFCLQFPRAANALCSYQKVFKLPEWKMKETSPMTDGVQSTCYQSNRKGHQV